MAINPENNRIEPCVETDEALAKKLADLSGVYANIVKANGEPVPKHWTTLTVGELVVVKDYTFRVSYMNDASVTLEPVSPASAIKETQ